MENNIWKTSLSPEIICHCLFLSLEEAGPRLLIVCRMDLLASQRQSGRTRAGGQWVRGGGGGGEEGGTVPNVIYCHQQNDCLNTDSGRG